MKKQEFREPRERFQLEPLKHNGHIGPGPKPGLKKAVNVSVDAEILGIAKELKINLSKALEDALRKVTEPERIRRWQEENRAVAESYNAYIERNGIFGEDLYEFEDDDPAV